MTTTDPSRRPRPSRPVSIGHLVAGLILTALSALWFVHELSDWRLPEPAIWGPVLLIVAGFIGLVVSLGNTRRSRDDGAVSPTPTDPGPVDPGPADPGPADPGWLIWTVVRPAPPRPSTPASDPANDPAP